MQFGVVEAGSGHTSCGECECIDRGVNKRLYSMVENGDTPMILDDNYQVLLTMSSSKTNNSKPSAQPMEFNSEQGVGYQASGTWHDVHTGIRRTGGGFESRVGKGPLDFTPENAIGTGAGTAAATTMVAAGAGSESGCSVDDIECDGSPGLPGL